MQKISFKMGVSRKRKCSSLGMWRMLIFLLVGATTIWNMPTASALRCHRCGTLDSSAVGVRDCESGAETEEECAPNEACVAFKRLYKAGSGTVRGCYPIRDTLPGLGGGLLLPKTRCDFQPKASSPIKVCMCSEDLCNNQEYDVHSERARRLFSDRERARGRGRGRGTTQRTPAARTTPNGRTPYRNETSGEEEEEGEETYYEDPPRGLEQLQRVPRQLREGNEVVDQQQLDRGIECYSCGSLFNLSAPSCPNFDRLALHHRKRCAPGQACLLYTWKRSSSEVGAFRECFSAGVRLGLAQDPVLPAQECEPQRTQADPASTIRACLCTTDLCNDVSRGPGGDVTAATDQDRDDFVALFRAMLEKPSVWARPPGLSSDDDDDRQPKRPARKLSTPKTQQRLPKRQEEDTSRIVFPGELQTPNDDDGTTTDLTSGGNRRRVLRPRVNKDGSVDCVWSDYGEWSLCSKSCGGGFQWRERRILLLARRGGRPCQGPARETRFCNRHRCPHSSGSNSNGGGVICKRVNVLGATYANCDGLYDHQPGLTVEWAPDRPVYKHRTKDRYIFWNAGGLGWSIGKKDYLETGSHWHRSGLDTAEPWQGRWERGVLVECIGKSPEQEKREKEREEEKPGPVDCLWSSFGDWSRCSVSCGSGGTQQRKRMVLQSARNGGRKCPGAAFETRSCRGEVRECPKPKVDCEWSRFGSWEPCSATCGGGVQSRRRTVLREAQNGGRTCVGTDQETRICNQQSCSVDCEWSDFGGWTACSTTCGEGVQARKRRVVRRRQGQGRECRGRSTEVRDCVLRQCPTEEQDPSSTTSTSTSTSTASFQADGFTSSDSSTELAQQQQIRTDNPGDLSTATAADIPLTENLLPPDHVNALPRLTPKLRTTEIPITASVMEDDVVTTTTTVASFFTDHNNDLTDEDLTTTTTATTTTTTVAPSLPSSSSSTTSSSLPTTTTTTSTTRLPKGPQTTTTTTLEPDSTASPRRRTEEGSCSWSEWESWGECSRSCEWGTQVRRRQVRSNRGSRGSTCDKPEAGGRSFETRICNRHLCGSEKCCDRVVVKATGSAKRDQSLYLGTYRKISNYNGHFAYKLEGKEQLYIYYYSSPADNLNLWVMGPELGEFIAGIRNVAGPPCVHDATTKWLYASRASVWKSDDPTLQVTCFKPEDAIDNPIFGAKKQATKLSVDSSPEKNTTSSRRPTTRPTRRPTTTRPTRPPKRDCVWSEFGEWSPCSRSCNTGVKSRFRTIERHATGGGRRCLGSRQESTTCNKESCNSLRATTRAPATTTTTRRTTTRGPRPPNKRVKCYVCGSLFSTDAPNCLAFNARDQAQQKTCDVGEACLWYSYQKSDDPADTAIIRECFSKSVLLGSISDPIEPAAQCVPKPVEKDETIMACICDDDFCNGLDGGTNVVRNTPRPRPSNPFGTTTTTRRPAISQTPRPTSSSNKRPNSSSSSKNKNQGPPSARRDQGVLCYQCGSLFSGSSGNSACSSFDADDSSQQSRCKPGEACLWYSWQKSETETSEIRECFSPSILLGPISNPLKKKDTCVPQDISDTPGSGIFACLCDGELCNRNQKGGSSSKRPPPPSNRFKEEPRRPATNSRPKPSKSSRPSSSEEDLTEEQLAALFAGVNRPPRPQDKPTIRPASRLPGRPQVTKRPASSPSRPSPSRNQPPAPRLPTSAGGLQCFSCGSLLDPSRECDRFDPTDPSQVQTCGTNEACLLYSWKKSSTETAVLRECFPTSVLLGDVSNPLRPKNSCTIRDISEDGSSSIEACMCNTNFCNNANGSVGSIPDPAQPNRAQQTRLPSSQQSSRPRPPATSRPQSSRPQSRPQTLPPRASPLIKNKPAPRPLNQKCPTPFEKLDNGGCYYFSLERMGWIEAKKQCELMASGARLVAIEDTKERDALLRRVQRSGRSRNEFWTSGNDIDVEGEWVWSGSGGRLVPSEFGWLDRPVASAEENCLAWGITFTRRSPRMSEGWHSDSCCNNIKFICEV